MKAYLTSFTVAFLFAACKTTGNPSIAKEEINSTESKSQMIGQDGSKYGPTDCVAKIGSSQYTVHFSSVGADDGIVTMELVDTNARTSIDVHVEKIIPILNSAAIYSYLVTIGGSQFLAWHLLLDSSSTVIESMSTYRRADRSDEHGFSASPSYKCSRTM